MRPKWLYFFSVISKSFPSMTEKKSLGATAVSPRHLNFAKKVNCYLSFDSSKNFFWLRRRFKWSAFFNRRAARFFKPKHVKNVVSFFFAKLNSFQSKLTDVTCFAKHYLPAARQTLNGISLTRLIHHGHRVAFGGKHLFGLIRVFFACNLSVDKSLKDVRSC